MLEKFLISIGLKQPEYVNINEISVDPIQLGAYARER